MKLTNKAIEAISNRKAILAIAFALDFKELWVNKLINANKKNGPLTTVTALRVIREETGLADCELLEDSEVDVANLLPIKD